MVKRFFSIRTWTWINLAAFAFCAGIEKLVAERCWFGILLITLPAYVLLVLPFSVLVACFVKRCIRPIFLNGTLLLASMGVYMCPSMSLSRASANANLKILTYNIKLGEINIAGILQTIKRESPDIVCLQEARLHGSKQIEDWFVEKLPNYHLIRNGDMALASKHPLTSVRLVPLYENGDGRKAQFIEVDLGSKRLTVVNTHLMHAHYGEMQSDPLHLPSILHEVYRIRKRQADELIAAASNLNGPVVICGDFNNPPQGLIYHSFSDRYSDAWARTNIGFGYTFVSGFPYTRIDYVWTNHFVQPVRLRVLPVMHSDHRPLVAELHLVD